MRTLTSSSSPLHPISLSPSCTVSQVPAPAPLLPSLLYPAHACLGRKSRNLRKPRRPLLIPTHWLGTLLEVLPSSQTEKSCCAIVHPSVLPCPSCQAVTCSTGLLSSGTPPPIALSFILTMGKQKQEAQHGPATLSPAAMEAFLPSFCCICFSL